MDQTAADHGERPHSDISPSGFKNRELCGEFQQCDIGEDPHPTTVEGTFLHEWLEDWWHNIITELEDKKDLASLTDEQVRLTKMCIDYVMQLRTYNTDPSRTIIEPKIDITENVWGFADRLQFSEDRKFLDIADWKFGRIPVQDAETNLQGICYVAGSFRAHPEVESIRIHFPQPRIDRITYHTFTRSQLPTLEDYIFSILGNVGSKRYFYDEDVCCYCTNYECPIKRNAALMIARNYQSEIIVPDNVHSSQITKPEDMGKLLDLLPMLEQWIKSVRFHAKRLAEEESWDIPGYELIDKKGNTTVNDVGLVYDLLSKDHGISFNQFLELFKKVSLDDVKKLVKEKVPRGKKTEAAEQVIKDLAECGAISFGKESSQFRKIKKKKSQSEQIIEI